MNRLNRTPGAGMVIASVAKTQEHPQTLWHRIAGANPGRPVLALAPMEGISDAIVRALLSELGGMDFAVTEFIRVTDRPISRTVLEKSCPELRNHGRTLSGIPVMVQLLGGACGPLAESAALAVELGAPGIDLNFGCPARRVNGSDGGAILLKDPSRVQKVIRAVRAACPASVPVSAKIRLGWDDPSDVRTLAQATEAGGASWLTIHARTKVQMYKPFADWHRIQEAKACVSIPVIANGDIFTKSDLARCRAATGCVHFMLGRGAFRSPNLFRWIRGLDQEPWSVRRAVLLLKEFVAIALQDPRPRDPQRVALNRLKCWNNALGHTYAELKACFETLKRMQRIEDALLCLDQMFGPEPPRSRHPAVGPKGTHPRVTSRTHTCL